MVSQAVESRVLQPEARAPAQSRQFVAGALTRWGMAALSDTAVLLTSELVTNAIVHAQTEVTVTIRREDRECVTISVQDGSSVRPRRASHTEDAATGRGLGILDTLANTWTVYPIDSGKVVTFSLRNPSIPGARGPRA